MMRKGEVKMLGCRGVLCLAGAGMPEALGGKRSGRAALEEQQGSDYLNFLVHWCTHPVTMSTSTVLTTVATTMGIHSRPIKSK